MSWLVEGVIADDDVVVVRGDRAFFDALAAILGDRARCLVNVDYDTRPDLQIGSDGEGGRQVSYPTQPGRAPERLTEEASPDPRPLVIYCGEGARNAKHLATIAPVILEADSPPLAKVVKLTGEPAAGLAVELVGDRAVCWHF